MNKKDYEEILEIYKDQMLSLREQVAELRVDKAALQEQNFRLQDSIMNVRAPEAYRNMVADRLPQPTGMSPEEKKRQQEYTYTYNSIIKAVEEPLFRGADDIFKMLTPALNGDGGPEDVGSIHGNDES